MDEYFDVGRLRGQGWSISAIARHLGRDRKTVRTYLSGARVPGVRTPARDEFLVFLPYCRRRLADDPHLPATALFEEVAELGYHGGYSTFTRALRRNRLRPSCARCRPRVALDPPGEPVEGEELRFSWSPLAPPTPGSPLGAGPYLLTGSLRDPRRSRSALADGSEFPHLVEALDLVLRRLGGTAPRWRFDRTEPVCCPTTGRLAPAFAQVGRYYGVEITLDPADRTAGPDPVHEAVIGRCLSLAGGRGAQPVPQEPGGAPAREAEPVGAPPAPVDGAADGARLLDLPPVPFPARVHAFRMVDPEGMVAFRGNRYAVPPDLAGAVVQVRHRLDEPYLSIAATGGAVITRHLLAPRGAGMQVTDLGGAIVLERSPRLQLTGTPPCPDGATRRPLSPEATAEAEALRRALRERRPRPVGGPEAEAGGPG
ncbi:Mu transposase domain-containing protein [Kitasatospora camelliae]|uniref:IS21 family transposase n=1 Tax=Kitasatospora camelliae TaxID=3156397 RepID=A0AAU8JUR2_9ACTN